MNTTQASKVASSIFIGRWTPKILFSLSDRSYQHGRLRRQLGSVSQRMLTRTLRDLESTGLVAQACDGLAGHFGRIFIDKAGQDNHRSTQRHVPLGNAIPEGGLLRSGFRLD